MTFHAVTSKAFHHPIRPAPLDKINKENTKPNQTNPTQPSPSQRNEKRKAKGK